MIPQLGRTTANIWWVSFLVAVGCLAVVASCLQLVQLVDYQWEPVLDEEDYADI